MVALLKVYLQGEGSKRVKTGQRRHDGIGAVCYSLRHCTVVNYQSAVNGVRFFIEPMA